LTDKQRRFINFYLELWNGTEAAAQAGYDGDRATLAVVASENLRKPKIRAAIEKRLESEAMGADEVLWRLGQQARGNLADFIDTDVPGGLIDMDAVAEKGYLLKKLAWTKSGLQIEMYDAQAALDKMGKAHSLFTDRIEHSGEISNTVRVIGGINLEDDV
jgi:phage terminase small subunit